MKKFFLSMICACALTESPVYKKTNDCFLVTGIKDGVITIEPYECGDT